MPGKVIGKTLDLGYAGTVSRNPDNISIARRVNEDSSKIAFGQAVKLNADNSVSLMGENDSAEDFVGVAIRDVKQSTDYFSVLGHYNANEAINILTRGSMTIKCNRGTPTANGKAYVRIKEDLAAPDGVVGGFEAEADGGNTVLVPNVVFTTGQTDTNGIAEITILSRKA